MNWQYTPYILPLLIAVAIPVGLAVYVWQRRSAPGAPAFSLLMLAVAEWSLGYALEIAGADLPTKIFWAKIEYLGIVSVPLVWLIFALQYTDRGEWLTRRNLTLLCGVPLITLLLAWTNEAHYWIWAHLELHTDGAFLALHLTYGEWFWVHVAFSYACLLVGSGLVILMLVRSPHLYRRQAGALLIGALAPWVGNGLYLSGLNPVPELDLTPFAFTLSGIAIGWGLFRFRLLDVVPVAHSAVVASMEDGAIVLDTQNRVVDLNPAAQSIIGISAAEAIGRPAARVLDAWPDLVERYRDIIKAQAELTFGEGETWRAYDLRISPLIDRRSQQVGRLLVLRDITTRKRAEKQRKQAEDELRAQKQLFENLVAVARATAERPTLEDTLKNALDVAVTLTDAEEGSLFLLDGSGAVINSILARGAVKTDQRSAIIDRVMNEGLAGWVFRHRRAALITDTSQDERWLALPGDPSAIRSVLAIPILSGTAVVGILTLTHSQVSHFNTEHVELMQAGADQMALAVRNAQIFEELRVMADRQITLYETLSGLSGQLDPDHVIRAAVNAIVEFVGWPHVAVLVPNETESHLVVHTARGELSPSPGATLPIDQEGIIGRTFTTARAQRVPDVSADPAYRDVLSDWHPAIRSKLVAPIKRAGQVLGVLNLESSHPEAFAPDDVLLAESLAEAIALALDNATLFQAIQKERGRLQALIKATRDGIIFISMDLHIRVVNESALRLLRLPDQPEDWVDRSIGEALGALRHTAPAIVKAALAEMRRIREGDEAPGEGEYEVPPHTIRWLTLPVLIGDTALGRLAVLRDVTEERAVERMREDMTRTMVHDLRNPLTSIVTSLGLLAQGLAGELAPQQHHILAIAENNARRMKELVNSILDVSRLESGQMPVEYESFTLADLVVETFQVEATLAQKRDVSLEKDIPSTLPAARADPALIRRVLQNLVGNALKFTPAEGTIRVRAWNEARKGHEVLLVAVSDTGPGIPPEIQSRLFQKFVAGRQEGSGSGLGLAFCKLAVEAHGERIWVESQPGQGSTFTFSLAIAPASP